MGKTWTTRIGRRPYPMVLAVFLLVPGCAEDEPDSEVVSLVGKIDKIDRTSDETGQITVVYYSEKHGQDMEGIGTVTAETEIMINGALAKLKDLRAGDHVRGEVRVEKKGKQRTQTALKIHVDRPKLVGGNGD